MRHYLPGLLVAFSAASQAAIQTEELHYKAVDGTPLVGYYAYDDAIAGKRPGIVVVHEWWGLNDYAKRRARDLAGLGYSALAIDMYGEGKNTSHPADAKAFMQAATASADTAKARFLAGLELLKAQPQTDPAKLGAIGYCFGGKVVLDMARQGVPLAGVVSFHGNLVPQKPATPGSVKARVLVAHGDADSFTREQDIANFKREMQQAGARYQFNRYPGAKHGFTNPEADELAKQGVDIGYQKEADERSWADMQAFFKDVFK